MLTLTCNFCSKVYKRYPSQIDKNQKHYYCSKKCFNKHKAILLKGIRPPQLFKEQRKSNCAYCGKEFRQEYKETLYCSIQCANKGKPKRPKTKFITYKRKRTDTWALIETECNYCHKSIKLQKWDYERKKHHFCKNNKACYRAWLKENRIGKNHPFFGKKPSPRAGRGNGGFVEELGHYVRSSWEANIGLWLKQKKIEYLYEPKTFIYEEFSYTPDFYTPHNNQYIEVKGWWGEDDIKKVDRFLKDGHNLWIIDEQEYIRLGFNSQETRNVYNRNKSSSTKS